MKLVVFGATGGTGQALLEQALGRGHEVTAAVRTPAKVSMTHNRLRVVQADVTDAEAVSAAVRGQEAVLSALGVSDFRPFAGATTVYSGGTHNILEAMKSANVERFIGVTSAGVNADPNEPLLYRLLVKPLLRGPYRDMRRMEGEVRASGLAWTLVRPVRLTDGPKTGRYRVAPDHRPRAGRTISRADVADFMLTTLERRDRIRHAVVLAY